VLITKSRNLDRKKFYNISHWSLSITFFHFTAELQRILKPKPKWLISTWARMRIKLVRYVNSKKKFCSLERANLMRSQEGISGKWREKVTLTLLQTSNLLSDRTHSSKTLANLESKLLKLLSLSLLLKNCGCCHWSPCLESLTFVIESRSILLAPLCANLIPRVEGSNLPGMFLYYSQILD